MKNVETSPVRTPMLKTAATLLAVMFKIGLFTWGGGWSIIAQMQREFIEKRNWISNEELLDIVSIARSLPGIMIANVSVLFGYHLCGPVCAIAALIGLASPAFLVMLAVTNLYDLMRDNVYVARVLVGIRAAVIPIIGASALKMFRTTLVDWMALIIALAALGLCLLTNVHKLIIVLAGAVFGLFWKGAIRSDVVS